MEDDIQTPRAHKPKTSFKREIVIVLLIKLALIIAIKIMFFSHPADKTTVEAHVDSVFSNKTSSPSTPALPSAKDSS